MKVFLIYNCGLGCDGVKKIANIMQNLKNKNSLNVLDISNNKLTSGGKETGMLVNYFPCMTEARIQFNTMDSKSTYKFLEAIKDANLSVLDIRDNKIDVEGCKLLGEYLYNWNIAECYLADCEIGDQGLTELINSYRKASMYSMSQRWTRKRPLLHFDISYNELGDDVLDLLYDFARENEIEVLNITGNDFEEYEKLQMMLEDKGRKLVWEEESSSDVENESELISAFDTKLNLGQ